MEIGHLIEDGVSLSDDGAASTIIGRKEELGRLHPCLALRLRSQPPANVWLCGPSGSGKTALARHTLEGMCGSAASKIGVYVNCWQHRSLYSGLQAVVDELKILRAEAQDTNFKLERIRQILRGRPLVIALDEIDRPMPRQRDEIIYGLLSLPRTRLICVANSTQPLAVMDERVRSRLNPLIIELPPYSREELEVILADRANRGLAPASWSPSVIKQISELAGGDARIAIQTLRRAAAAAEEAGRDGIDKRVVSQILKPWCNIVQEQRQADLTEDERAIVQQAIQHAPVGTTRLRQLYAAYCHNTGRQPVARRTFSKYVRRLAAAGLLNMASRPMTPGGRLVRAVTT